jgi:hypothetical protein
LKFKHLFEKKARPTHGKYVTFFSILGFWDYRAAGWPQKPLSIEEFADCCSVEGGEPQGVGDRAIKLSDRGERGGSACLGAHFAFQTIILNWNACLSRGKMAALKIVSCDGKYSMPGTLKAQWPL